MTWAHSGLAASEVGGSKVQTDRSVNSEAAVSSRGSCFSEWHLPTTLHVRPGPSHAQTSGDARKLKKKTELLPGRRPAAATPDYPFNQRQSPHFPRRSLRGPVYRLCVLGGAGRKPSPQQGRDTQMLDFGLLEHHVLTWMCVTPGTPPGLTILIPYPIQLCDTRRSEN